MNISPIRSRVRLAAFASVALLALPAAARAQTAVESGIWTLQDENASIATNSPSDRFYVNGVNLSWTSPVGMVPDSVAGFGHALFGDGAQRINLGLEQQLYTPFDTRAINPPKNDEPYAGYLVVNLSLIQDTANTRSILCANLGVIGAGAGGEIVQNGFHAVIGQSGTHGWAYQLPTEPAVDFLGARIWRLPLAQFGGIETDALPQISAMAGLTEDYVQPALGLRLGQNLNADFGPSLLTNSPSGGDAYDQSVPIAWYVFGSAAAKLVGWDETLEGSDFQSSRSVPVTRTVGTFEAGAAIIWRGWRFSFTQVFQTSRFQHETGNIHEFGSFAVSGTF